MTMTNDQSLNPGKTDTLYSVLLRELEGILPKGPYLPCVSMAGRALLAGYPRAMGCLESILEELTLFFFNGIPI